MAKKSTAKPTGKVKTGAPNTATDEFLSNIKERYIIAQQAWHEIYRDSIEDMEFAYDVGDGQWPSAVKTSREKDGRPVLTINKLQKFLRKMRGEQQMNRPSMKVIPVDDTGDVEMAKLYNGLIRQIEYLSSADIAYDTAYNHAISGSIGFFRIITDYVDPLSFDQEIRIERVLNPLSVHFDPSAKKFNYEDAQDCFIEELIDKSDFEHQYPDATVSDFDGYGALFGDWVTAEKVRIAEYFYKEFSTDTIVQLSTGEVVKLGDGITVDSLELDGERIISKRKSKSHKVMWCKISGGEVLEGPQEWPGKYIPIIPVFGDEVVCEGKKYYLSAIRGAKGPQSMYNYWATAATETVAQTPKTPFIIEAKQIKGYESEWNMANVTNTPYMRYNHVQGMTKPQREPQTTIPTGIISVMQTAGYDVEDHLGQYESSKGAGGNERTGKAIQLRISQSDKGLYTFIDNLTRAEVYGCRQLIDLIPKIYDRERALMIMNESGENELVEFNSPGVGQNGKPMIQNDLSVGKYDLVATVGPSFDSRRQEMTQMMIESLQYAPDLAMVIAPLIFKYSDFPGSDEIANQIGQEAERIRASQQTSGAGSGNYAAGLPQM